MQKIASRNVYCDHIITVLDIQIIIYYLVYIKMYNAVIKGINEH